MKTSEAIDMIIPALLEAQKHIQAVMKDKVGKVQTRTGAGYEYKYSDLASVIEHVKPHLNDAGIFFSQSAQGDSVSVHVETRLFHTSGQWIASTVFLPVAAGTAQAYGSAITYGKRYGLQSLCGLPSEDDDGSKASEPNKPSKAAALPRAIPANVEGQETFEAYDAETKEWLRTHADTVERMHKEGRDADMVGYVNKQEFDTETKLALWWLLPSGVRSAFKKASKEVREMESAA